MGGISIAKKIVLYIFLVFTTLGAIPRDTYGGDILCVSGHPEESNHFDEKCHAGNHSGRNQPTIGY